MTNQYRKQSKQPKPLTMQQVLARFKRDMREMGYSVDETRGNGRYAPALSLQMWPSMDKKEAGK